MDNITSEVSKKVKSAIKAKLMELGAYVDDELPDYIMILVGNKKTKDQMEDDLSLFLGHNTERFTSWLHTVLQKLNAAAMLQGPKVVKEKEKKKEEEKKVESDSQSQEGQEKKKHKKKKDKSEKKKEKKEKKKKKDKDRERDRSEKQLLKAQKKKEKEAALGQVEVTAARHKTVDVTVQESRVKSDDNTDQDNLRSEVGAKIFQDKTLSALKLRSNSVTENRNDEDIQKAEDKHLEARKRSEEDEEDSEDHLSRDVMDLRPDAADLALDLEDEPPVAPKKKLDAPTAIICASESFSKPQPLIIQVKNDLTTIGISDNMPTEEEHLEEAPKCNVHDRLGPATAPSKRIINLREESSFPPKSVSEEGMGRVVSSAIASAVRSVSIVGLRNANDEKPCKRLEARVRPLVSSRVVTAEDDDNISALCSRVVSTVGAVLKRPHCNDESDENDEPAAKKVSGIASKVEVTPRPKRPTSMQANTALILRAVADAHKSVNKPAKRPHEEKDDQREKKEIFTRSYQERHNQRLGPQLDSNTGVKKFAITVPNALLTSTVLGAKTGTKKGDTSMDKVEINEDYLRQLEALEKEEVMESLVEEGPEKPPHMKVQKTKRKASVQAVQGEDSMGSTRFIVTLDGFGNNSSDLRSQLSSRPVRTPSVEEVEEYIEEVEEWEEEEEEMEVQASNQKGNVAPVGAVTYGAKLKLVKDPVTQVTKKEERCRYWPSCKEGDACKYIHPSKTCTTFPKCRFGDKCLYIHPKCKFDSLCMKANCPFTHTVPHSVAGATSVIAAKPKFPVTAPQFKIKCHYYPKCIDMNCPYMHPKQICRYGKVCQTPSCPFIHPDVTTGALLKWTASKTSTLSKTTTSGPTTVAASLPHTEIVESSRTDTVSSLSNHSADDMSVVTTSLKSLKDKLERAPVVPLPST